MAFTDGDIIQSIYSGTDSEVLKHLYRTVLPMVKSYIVKNNGTNEDAFDIFQEAVMVFYRYVKEDKFNKGQSVSNFIFCIARNAWINKAKRDKRNKRIDDDFQLYEDDAKNALQGIISEERENLIREMLQKLGKKCEELLLYSIYENRKLKEICEMMGFTSVDAVKTRKYKCKQKLIEIFKKYQLGHESFTLD